MPKTTPTQPELPSEVSSPGEIEEVSSEELAQLDKSLTEAAAQGGSIHASGPAAIAAQASAQKLRTIQEIEADLKKPVPAQYVKKLTAGPAKGKSYVPWIIVQRMLSFYAPGWSTKSTAISTPVGVGVITELTIPTATGDVTRCGHGFEPHQTASGKDTGFGGAIVVASAMAFKRSAVAYGLARDLYPI